MADPHDYKFPPSVVIARRIRPAGKNITPRKIMPVWLRVRGECLRHESDLHQRLHSIPAERIKNAIRDNPVVYWCAVRQLRVDIG